jgi:hypothetical protein
MNKEWHANNKMPRNATLEQRIAWHLDHAEKCACREIPPGLRAIIAERWPEQRDSDPLKPADGAPGAAVLRINRPRSSV